MNGLRLAALLSPPPSQTDAETCWIDGWIVAHGPAAWRDLKVAASMAMTATRAADVAYWVGVLDRAITPGAEGAPPPPVDAPAAPPASVAHVAFSRDNWSVLIAQVGLLAEAAKAAAHAEPSNREGLAYELGRRVAHLQYGLDRLDADAQEAN